MREHASSPPRLPLHERVGIYADLPTPQPIGRAADEHVDGIELVGPIGPELLESRGRQLVDVDPRRHEVSPYLPAIAASAPRRGARKHGKRRIGLEELPHSAHRRKAQTLLIE